METSYILLVSCYQIESDSDFLSFLQSKYCMFPEAKQYSEEKKQILRNALSW